MGLFWRVDFYSTHPTKEEQWQNEENIVSSLLWWMHEFIVVTYRNLGQLRQCHHGQTHLSKNEGLQRLSVGSALQLAGSDIEEVSPFLPQFF